MESFMWDQRLFSEVPARRIYKEMKEEFGLERKLEPRKKGGAI